MRRRPEPARLLRARPHDWMNAIFLAAELAAVLEMRDERFLADRVPLFVLHAHAVHHAHVRQVEQGVTLFVRNVDLSSRQLVIIERRIAPLPRRLVGGLPVAVQPITLIV